MKNLSLIFLSIFLLSFISACKSDDPTPENPEELITTLTMVFTPHGGGAAVTMLFRDLDGDGGNAPLITSDNLLAQTEYHAELTLLNESESPSENITEEILEEGEAHQFFFEISGIDLTHAYDDLDGNGKPIGVINTFMTGGAATGTLKVTLRHNPDKSAAGVANGAITNAGGETDIEVVFPVTIQ